MLAGNAEAEPEKASTSAKNCTPMCDEARPIVHPTALANAERIKTKARWVYLSDSQEVTRMTQAPPKYTGIVSSWLLKML